MISSIANLLNGLLGPSHPSDPLAITDDGIVREIVGVMH